jgi:hypothetical protein
MTIPCSKMLFATIAALGLAGAAQAQKPDFEILEHAVEILSGKVTLPSTPESGLVMPRCWDCPPKSYETNAETRYFLGDQEVSLGEFRAAVAPRVDTFLTVKYALKTGVVLRVTADIVPPTPTR